RGARASPASRTALKEVRMSLAETFPGIEDFLAVDREGRLGRFAPDEEFQVFERLSEVVREHAVRLLEGYQHDPDSPEIRPAILLPPLPGRKWQSASLLFDIAVLGRLFPNDGSVDPAILTSFQSRNRERSIYQGMELLIGFEHKSMPAAAFPCRVRCVGGRGGRVCPDFVGPGPAETGGHTPVLEVLHRVALLSPRERARGWARELVRLIRDISIEHTRR